LARPSPDAIALALDRLRELAVERGGMHHREAYEIVRRATELPPLVGNRAAAEILGVASGNLHKQAELPAPLYELPAGKHYDADAIRELAARRAASTDTTETETVPHD
jgi:hypothetical protein